MQTWKYHIEEVELSPGSDPQGPPDEDTPQEIEELEVVLVDSGSEGWELVSLFPIKGGRAKVLAIFKQPLRQE
ncbi:MAG: DUF4177 domain-containing protein [Acidobacteria bacterium]|nr:DUF4177 domain-containing protein [Acidobacteriota bacterium]